MIQTELKIAKMKRNILLGLGLITMFVLWPGSLFLMQYQEQKERAPYETIKLDSRYWTCTQEDGAKIGGAVAHPPECTQYTRKQ